LGRALAAGACLLALAISSSPARAEKHALLIGLGEYRDGRYSLEGPPNDAGSIRGLLVSQWGFDPAKVRTLINREATRGNILGALQDLERTSRPGDLVLFYFSGHGTSAYDPRNAGLGLDKYTGALVPYDFTASSGEEAEAVRDRLLIGKRDLRPILERLDRDRRVVGLIDACYSEYGMRRVRRGSFRQINLPWTLFRGGPSRTRGGPGIEDDLIGDDLFMDQGGGFGAEMVQEPPYPYQSLIYLTASSKREKARDITGYDIRAGTRTFDGRPHGAFTEALVRALSGAADLDRDGRVTYQELYGFVREEVGRRFSHTPQLLFNRKDLSLLGHPFLETVPQVLSQPPPEPETRVKIRLVGLEGELGQTIGRLAGVVLVEQGQDLLVAREEGGYTLYAENGHLLVSLPLGEPGLLLDRIRREAALKRLELALPEKQGFGLHLEQVGRRGLLLEGDLFGCRLRAERDCCLLLFNVDPTGFISVIYPYYPSEMAPLRAGRELALEGIGRVKPPLGTELIVALAFEERPKGFGGLMAAELEPGDRRFECLVRMVASAGGRMAHQRLRVKTAESGEVRSTLGE